MKSRISRKSIDPAKALESVMDEDAGGIVLFVGTIRNQTNGKKVKGLEYEVYRRMAERQIAKLEKEIRKRWPIKSIRLVHREGKLKVGEVSVVVAVSAVHREEAFEAHPKLRPLGKAIKVAVNEEITQEDAPLQEGDRVALLPPVVGG